MNRAFGLGKEYREVYSWFDDNTAIDSVVVTLSTEHNMLIPVYTHNNVFIPNGFSSSSPTEEIIDRMFTVYKIFNVTPEHFGSITNGEMLKGEYDKGIGVGRRVINASLFEKSFWSNYPFHYKFWSFTKLDSDSSVFGETNNDRIYDKMLQYFRNFTPSDRYKMDYLLVGDYEKGISNFTLPLNFIRVWSNDRFDIYKIGDAEGEI